MRRLAEIVLVGGACLVLLIIGLAIIGSTHSAGAGSAGNNLSCSAADFALSKISASYEYGYAKVTGIVTSNCAAAAGVQLKWTAFNADGTVAFSQDFWPASTTNIPPHTNYAFETMDSAPRGKWTYQIEPVNVNVW